MTRYARWIFICMKGWYYIKKKHMKEGKLNETKQEK